MEVEAPKGFKGRLAAGEKWMQCVYDQGHKYLNIRDAVHLTRCREMYKIQRKKEGKPVDIAVCRFVHSHHVLKSELEDHELDCQAQFSYYAYLVNYVEAQRLSKQPNAYMKPETAQKQQKVIVAEVKPPEVKKKEEDEPKVGIGRGRGRGIRGRGK